MPVCHWSGNRGDNGFKGNDGGIHNQLAAVVEIDSYLVTDSRLHLTVTPVWRGGISDKSAGCQAVLTILGQWVSPLIVDVKSL